MAPTRRPPKPRKLPAPTEEYLLDLRTELVDAYKDDDRQIDTMREVRELKRIVPVPDSQKLVDIQVRDPTCTDEIARVAATLSVNRPRMQVTPTRPTDTAQENATLREHWTEEVMWRAGSKQPGVNAFERFVDAVVGDGGGWLKLQCDFDSWDIRYSIKSRDFTDEVPDPEAPDAKPTKSTDWRAFNDATDEAKRSSDVPFRLSCVDVRTVYPVFTADRLTAVMEVTRRPRHEAFRQYQLDTDRAGRIRRLADADELVPEELGEPEPVSPSDSTSSSSGDARYVTFIEHHDETYSTYLVSGLDHRGHRTGVIVAQWEHGMGQPPYFWAPGVWMNHWRNRKVGWSVSESKRWLVEYRSYLWTVHSNLCARDAFAPLMRETDAAAPRILGEDSAPKKDERWQLGVIYDLKPGEKLVPLVFPPVAQALREEIQIIGEAIERLETPRVSGSIGGGLEGAGYAVNQILSEAKLRFQPISSSIERAMADATRFLWKLVRTKIRETVFVYRERGKDAGWIKAGPDDLTEAVELRWNLDPEKPSAKVIESRYHHERLQAGTEDLSTAVSRMGDNPDEIRLGLALDRMRASKWYTDYQERYVLAKAARGDLLKRAADATQQAQSGAVPGPNGPPPDGGPGPAMGMGGAGVAGGGGPQDMANLAMAPHGAGAMPAMPPGVARPGMGPGPGGIPGVGPGAVIPQQAAAAGIQRLV